MEKKLEDFCWFFQKKGKHIEKSIALRGWKFENINGGLFFLWIGYLYLAFVAGAIVNIFQSPPRTETESQ